jgi:hypothetical protein
MDLSFRVCGKRIEAAWHGPAPEEAPTLVLLHEGLGSVAMWKEFPQKISLKPNESGENGSGRGRRLQRRQQGGSGRRGRY